MIQVHDIELGVQSDAVTFLYGVLWSSLFSHAQLFVLYGRPGPGFSCQTVWKLFLGA
jgi:hypothetical protein